MTEEERRQGERRDYDTVSWAEAQQALFDRRYTGPTLVHWNNGLPYEVSELKPVTRVRVHHGEKKL